jgi:uncharacterized membrane protein YphA (DoxX/SURF4 family)
VSFLLDRRVASLLRIGLGVLFLAAAVPKLQDPAGFAKAIENYRMLPVGAERALAVVLPAVELVVGVLLVAGAIDAGASLLALVLLVVFTGAVGVALARGLDFTCGCFGTGDGTRAGTGKVLENLALIAVALAVWRGDRSWLSLRGWLARRGDIE